MHNGTLCIPKYAEKFLYTISYPAQQHLSDLSAMKPTPENDMSERAVDTSAASRWRSVKTIAAIVVFLAVLASVAGTVLSMNRTFRDLSESGLPIPVDEVSVSIESSLQLGAWLSPVIIAFTLLWFVARMKLKKLDRAMSWPNRAAG